MALTWQTPGAIDYSQQNGTSVAPAYPANCNAGDYLILFVGQKPATANGGTLTVPAYWGLAAKITGGGYGSTLGADVGNTNLYVLTRVVPNNGLSGNLTVTLGDSNVAWAYMARISKTSSFWDAHITTGTQSAGGNVSITMGSDPGVTSGDLVIGAMCIPTDVTTPNQFSAEAFTQSGVTFNTAVEINEPDTQTGNDIGGFTCYATVASGTSSGAPTLSATAGGTTTNVRGPAAFIRLREVATDTNERYWVNGSNSNWSLYPADNVGDSNLSLTSGGIGGAPLPSSTTDLIFDDKSWDQSADLSIYGNFSLTYINCKDFKVTHTSSTHSVQFNTNGGNEVRVNGNIACTTNKWTSSACSFQMVGAGSHTINTGHSEGSGSLYLLGISGSGTYGLSNPLIATNYVVLTSGTFNTNNYLVKALRVTDSGSTSVKTANLGTSEIKVDEGWIFTGTNLSVDANSSTINYYNGATAATFNGRNLSYGTLKLSCLTLSTVGSSSFDTIQRVANLTTITFTSGSSQTIRTNFLVSGSPGANVSLLSSAPGYQTFLTKSSGVITCDYLTLKDQDAMGGATWYAGSHSTNSGNNTGWIFTDPPSGINLTGNNAKWVNTSTTGAITQTRNMAGNNAKWVNTSTTGAITQTQTLTGNSAKWVNTSTTGAINRTLSMTGSSVAQVNTSTSAAVSQKHNLTGNSVAQPNTTTSGAINRTLTITGYSVAQVNTTTTGAINRTLSLTGNSVAQVNTASTGAIERSLTLSGNSIAQPNTSSTGAISQTQVLQGNSVAQVNTSTTGAVVTEHDLTANSVAQSNTTTTEAISRTLTLTGNAVAQTNTTTSGAITSSGAISGNSVAQINTSTTGAISQTQTLTAAESAQVNQSTSGFINTTQSVTGNNVAQINQSSSGALSQTQTLIGNAVAQSNTSTAGAIDQDHVLTGNAVAQVNTATGGAIQTEQSITGQSVAQSNTSTSDAVSQIRVLQGNSVAENHTCTIGVITQTQVLTGQSVEQVNKSSSGSIGQAGDLLANNVAQVNTSSSGVITQTQHLTANSVAQPNTSTGAAISQAHKLIGAAVAQRNTAYTGAITQTQTLLGNTVAQRNTTTSGRIGQGNKLTGAANQQVNTTSSAPISLTYRLVGQNVRQVNQSSADAITQFHQLLGANVAQINLSTKGAVFSEGELQGNSVVQLNQTSIAGIAVFPVLSAPGGDGYTPQGHAYIRYPNSSYRARTAETDRNRK